MRVSALPTLSTAIIRALKADASLAALVGVRVYQGRAPASVLTGTASYITIITPSENADNSFGRGGTLNAEQVHIWAASDQQVRVAAGHIMRVLANDPLYIGGGFDIVARDINLVTILRDPDNGMSHGVLRFLTRLSQWPDWPGVWEPTSDTVLFAEAYGQDPSSQIVRSRIGPNGWLGDSASTTTNDPTYGTSPARWVMGEVSGRGVNFGDVLDTTLDSDAGFTIAVPFEVALSGHVVIWQKFDLGAGIEGPLLHVPTSGFVGAVIHYEGGTADIDFVSSLASVIAPGTHLLGYHFDRTLARTARHGLWLDGAPLAIDAVFQLGSGGDDLSVATPGAPFWLGGPNTATPPQPKLPPVSAGAIAVAEGVMDADWHAGFYAHAQARGWV